MEEFLKNVIVHQYEVLLIDSMDYPALELEKRYIVDEMPYFLCFVHQKKSVR